jgi:hypothetical protein
MQIAADPFFRANGPPGANWTQVQGTFAITSNALGVATVNAGQRAAMLWNANSFPADHYSKCILRQKGTGNTGQGPAARVAGVGQMFYGFYADNIGNVFLFYSTAVGGATILASGPFATNIGDELYIDAVGSRITAKVNGVVYASVIDNTIASGAAGLQGAILGGNTQFIDTWSAGTPGSPGGLLLSGVGT